MNNKTLDLAILLPHRAPMLLLSAALDYGADFAKAQVHISSTSPLFDAELDGVPGWVGIEYMAQTIGIWSGSQQLVKNPQVHAGFLLGCNHYDCSTAVFPAGSILQVSAQLVYHDDKGLGAFDCQIDGDNMTARAQIKAFSPDNPEDFVRPFSLQKETKEY